MEMIAPDLLADAAGLSLGFYIGGLLVGLALWLLGWRWHRFWVVLSITLLAGLYGLAEGPTLHAHPLVAGVMLALAAGLVALALARLIAFAAGGIAALIAVAALVPTWDHHLVSFLGGGLLGVLLFRIWITALTSLGGTLLIAYCTLCLLDRFTTLDVMALARGKATLLNWACGSAAALGLLLQLLLGRKPRKKSDTEKSSKSRGEKQEAPAPRRWLEWPAPRKAG